MKYNWPDRMKLIFINVLLNTILGIIIAVFMMFQDSVKHYLTSLKQMFFVGILFSVIFTLPIFMKEWNKLRRQEDAGELPDMQDMGNISSRQMILFAIGFPFLITGVVVFQLYSKLAGVLCFIPYLVLWMIETVYVKKRYKKIKQDKEHKPGNP